MSTELREQLQARLGTAYTLERELAGAGMSRVFVAEETQFRRRVVVKVLAPELAAGLLVDRFEREVRFAARLQDPHIVPVLSAGELDGLPYYTMPFVDGPTLRTRLRNPTGTGGPLSIADAVAILRDVARALAYAHAHGVVHRDIKPENVLLAGDTALVTDFGIAKALEASTTVPRTELAVADGADGGTTLTRLGAALGTPAYMAPEQATGERVDARADLYAWGMLAYELLSGRHPFSGKATTQQLIAAQLGETPPPLASVARGVPAALATLVMRCLAKDPTGRPSSADEILTVLRDWSAGGRTDARAASAPRRRVVRRIVVGSVIALPVIAAAGLLMLPADVRATLRTLVTRSPATLRVNRVVVAPFKDESGDPKLAALGSLTADYLAEGLSRLASLEVVDATTAAQTHEVVRRIPRLLRPADERSLGEETGAKVVVAGAYYLLGDSIVFRARIVDAETGSIRTTLPPVSVGAQSPTSGVVALTARVVAALRAASDEDATDLGGMSPPPSLAAFAAFREAYQAYLLGKPDSAIFTPLRRAMSLDSTYGAPAVAYAFIAPDRLGHAEADSALSRARALRDRLTPQEQALLDLTDARAVGDVAAALDAARRTGVQQLVAREALLARRPRVALAALRSTDPDRGINLLTAGSYWSMLTTAHVQLGDWSGALAAVDEGQHRVPTLPSDLRRLMIYAARGDADAVQRALENLAHSGGPDPPTVAQSTAILRMRAGREREGRALAASWADRLLEARTGSSASVGYNLAMADLLGSAGRWREAAAFVEHAEQHIATDSTKLAGSISFAPAWHRHVQLRRAVTLLHLDRRAEALAIDSALTREEGQRWEDGQATIARGVIAAHLGNADAAIAQLERAIARRGLSFFSGGFGIGTLDDLMLLLPLRNDPRYRALASPAQDDGR